MSTQVTYQIVKDKNISSSYKTSMQTLGSLDDFFNVQVIWKNGSSVDMDIQIELSNDPIDDTFCPITASLETISDTSGVYMRDVNTAAQFMRINIIVRSGNADFSVKVSGKDNQ